MDPVIGDLDVMAPTVYVDAAAPLRTTADAQPIDAGWVAIEVARERILGGRSVRPATVGITKPTVQALRAIVKQGGAVGECAGFCDGGTGPRIRAVIVHAFRRHRNGCSFVRAHQGWLLQELRQVAVEGGIPAHRSFQRQTIRLAKHCEWVVRTCTGRAGVCSARIVRVAWLVSDGVDGVVDGRTIQRQSEETNDPPPPRIQLQYACWLCVGVDDAGRGSDTLQPDRLPHQQHLTVVARRNDDQVARQCGIDGRLDRLTCRQHGRNFASVG